MHGDRLEAVSIRQRVVLTTPRLTLRELELQDIDFIAAMLSNPEVMRHYPKCYTREEAVGWIERQRARYAADGHGLWLATDRVDRRPIGQIGVLEQDVEGQRLTEIGYLVHRPYWRLGYAFEAARAARDHAFSVLGRERVISLIRPANAPSQALARKLGERPAGMAEFRGHEHLVFTLYRDEWLSLKEGELAADNRVHSLEGA